MTTLKDRKKCSIDNKGQKMTMLLQSRLLPMGQSGVEWNEMESDGPE